MGLKQAYMIYRIYKETMIISVEILYTTVLNYFSNEVIWLVARIRSSILLLVFNCLRINLSIWRRVVRTLIISVAFSVELLKSHNMGLDLVTSCFERCDLFIVPSI